MTKPSTKWIVTQITAICGLATAVALHGSWTTTHTVAAITIVAQALIGYLTPNTTADLARQKPRTVARPRAVHPEKPAP